MSKRAPGKFEHRENDFYPTPAKAVVPLIPHLRRYNIRRFCEPCRGDGWLVKYLESFGLTCVLASDIAEGQDALDIPSFPAPVITNPPHTWKLLRRLIEHFMANAPCAWLLIPSDWMSNERTQRLMTHCSDSVPVRRLRDCPGSAGVRRRDGAGRREPIDVVRATPSKDLRQAIGERSPVVWPPRRKEAAGNVRRQPRNASPQGVSHDV